ncbi:MAG: GntR family transcriptional regulator [Sphaerochaetaceae bacterium]|jgi:DNA-binding GntR family transcriptional regulator
MGKNMPDTSATIFDTLKNELTCLTIKPGQPVVESEVCARFGVTRPPVRTVFQRLQDIGLLEIVPYKGAYATLLDLDEIYQEIFFRTATEGRVIQEFIALKPDDFTLEDILHNIRLQKLLISQDTVDEKRFYHLDCSMHEIWFRKMHCEAVWKKIQSDIVYERFRMLDFVGTLKYQEIVHDHEVLFDAISQRRPQDIDRILGSHLNAGLRRMGELIVTEYRQYFKLSDNAQYWIAYNKRHGYGKNP